MTIEEASTIALSMPNAEEHQHFQKIGFRLKARTAGKPGKIFMTIAVEEKMAVLLLTVEQQTELHAHHPTVFFPVPNKWGEKGATFVQLDNVTAELFKPAVEIAWRNAPPSTQKK